MAGSWLRNPQRTGNIGCWLSKIANPIKQIIPKSLVQKQSDKLSWRTKQGENLVVDEPASPKGAARNWIMHFQYHIYRIC